MQNDFSGALKFTLAQEGGYGDAPGDPGGPTNLGITQNVYDMWRRSIGQPVRSVRFLALEEASAIYKSNYWDPTHGDYTPSAVSYVLFDTSVNNGVGRAIQFLQQVLGIHVTYAFDAPTSEAFHTYLGLHSALDLASALLNRREAYDKSLVDEADFLPGWIKRIESLRALVATL